MLYQYIAMYCDVLMYCATGALTPRACEYTSKIHQFLRRRECLTCSRLLQNAPYWYQDGPLCLGTLPGPWCSRWSKVAQATATLVRPPPSKVDVMFARTWCFRALSIQQGITSIQQIHQHYINTAIHHNTSDLMYRHPSASASHDDRRADS